MKSKLFCVLWKLNVILQVTHWCLYQASCYVSRLSVSTDGEKLLTYCAETV